MGAVMSCIQGIGDCIMTVIRAIAGVIMSIVNGIVAVLSAIVRFLTCEYPPIPIHLKEQFADQATLQAATVHAAAAEVIVGQDTLVMSRRNGTTTRRACS